MNLEMISPGKANLCSLRLEAFERWCMISKRRRRMVTEWVVLGCVILLSACSGQSGQRAAQGGTMGAVVGAAGGLVGALVFGGNVGEAAARGAVWGGTTGAVSGAIVGSQQDQAKKKQQGAAAEKLKKKLGAEASSGLVALANCKYDVALGHAKSAENLDNKEHALAGLWLEILTHADQQEEGKARALFPDLIEKDPKVGSAAEAEENMRNALQGLMKIRAENNLPKTCR